MGSFPRKTPKKTAKEKERKAFPKERTREASFFGQKGLLRESKRKQADSETKRSFVELWLAEVKAFEKQSDR